MKGTYVLIIENHADTEVEIGKMGNIEFKKGFYAYVGSALSGLEQRIGRHLREADKSKKLHWHIDYFLASPSVEVKEVVFAETGERKECEIAANMDMHMEKGLNSIENFGCTDCSCKSHLFFSTSLTRLKEHVYNSFYESGFENVHNKDF
ncbi:MAG: GIY-YIG nuclease family protein [Methanophagales archaeon]|nr:GIY-YIG nuclease family protein [Methanophagales archaeon]